MSLIKHSMFKFLSYPIIVLFFAVLHTLNVIIIHYDTNAKLVFLSSFAGKVCTAGREYLLYNLSSLIVFVVLLINYIAYLLGNKYNAILKAAIDYITVYNLLFLLLLLGPNKLVLYFPYLKEITRLSLVFDFGYYMIIYSVTFLFLILMIIGHFKIKKLKLSLILYSLLSFLIYVLAINTLVQIIIRIQ